MLRCYAALAATVLALAGCTSTPGSNGHPGHGASSAVASPDSQLLPNAAAVPSGSPQQQAKILAAAISKGGTGAEAALRTSLVLSGISTADFGGKVADTGAKPQLGIIVPVGEIAAVADSDNYQHQMAASDIASSIALLIGDAGKQAAIAKALLNGLRAQSGVGRPSAYPATVQFLSALIEFLGDDASPATNVEKTGNGDVEFTGLQSWLIWLGLAASAAETQSLQGRNASSLWQGYEQIAGPAPAAQRAASSGSGCAPDDTAGTVMNFAATGLTFGAGKIPWDRISDAVGAAVSKYVNLANIALSLAHLLTEDMTFTGSIDLVGGQPLVRTKQTHGYDERRVLVAHAEFHLHGGQWANCLRTAINMLGLDFSLPNDGPISGADVQWEMDNSPGGVLDNPVEFYLLNGASTGSGVNSKTDGNGDARTGLEGMPQPIAIADNALPRMRQVGIWANLAVTANDFLHDSADALSAAVGGLSGAGAGSILSIITGLLEHTHSFGIHQQIQVKDWTDDLQAWDLPDRKDLFYKCGGPEGEWHMLNKGDPGMTVPELTFDMHRTGSGYTGTMADGQVTLTFRYQPSAGGGNLIITANPGGPLSNDPVQIGSFCTNGQYTGG